MRVSPRALPIASALATLTIGVLVVIGRVEPPPRYTVPTPDPQEVAFEQSIRADPKSFIGVRVTARNNQVSDGVLAFDWVRYDSCGCFDVRRPRLVTLQHAGFWRLAAQVTVLGTGYGGTPVSDVSLIVGRVDDASGFLVFDRVSDGSPDVAAALGGSTTDWYEAGTEIEVRVSEGITVEANWPGRSNVSPVLVATYLGR